MYVVRIITAPTSESLEGKCTTAFNKLVKSPIVSDISIQYAVAVIVPGTRDNPPEMEYSCMISYAKPDLPPRNESTITNQ